MSLFFNRCPRYCWGVNLISLSWNILFWPDGCRLGKLLISQSLSFKILVGIFPSAGAKFRAELESASGNLLVIHVVVKVEFVKEGKTMNMILQKFLEKECDESLHEFIRTNVFTATRNFIQRVRSSRTEIMMGKNNPMKIKYWCDKMEFQGRGAGHIHGVAWSDLAEISKLIEKEKRVGVVLCNDENTSGKGEETEEVNHLENAY